MMFEIAKELKLMRSQKGVMISHRNVIANVMQFASYEKPWRDTQIEPGNQSDYIETILGLLPMSHIYALVLICHASTYRGDGVIVLPKFEFKPMLEAIQRFSIEMLFLVSQSERAPSISSQISVDRYLAGQLMGYRFHRSLSS